MRILVGSDFTITSPVWVGADGETPADIDESAMPTVTITNAEGDTLEAVEASSLAGEVGIYQVKLTAEHHTARIDKLTLTWSGTADGHAQTLPQSIDIVDGHYATLAELRAVPELDDVTRFPSWLLMEARDSYAELVERARGASWVGVLRTEVHRDRSPLVLHRPFVREVRSITRAGAAVDLDGVVSNLASGILDLSYATSANYVADPAVGVAYVHGERGMPGNLRRGCREYVLARCQQEEGAIPRNALSWGDGQGGTYRTSTANWDAGRYTGLMAVDDEINAMPDYRVPAVG